MVPAGDWHERSTDSETLSQWSARSKCARFVRVKEAWILHPLGRQFRFGQLADVGAGWLRGKLVKALPKISDQPEKSDEFLVTGRFLNEGVGAQVARAGDVIRMSGSRKDDNHDSAELRLRSQPGQYLQPVHARHAQVEQHNLWNWEVCAVGVSAMSLEIIDGSRAGIYCFEARGYSSGFSRKLDQAKIVFVIIDAQNTEIAGVHI